MYVENDVEMRAWNKLILSAENFADASTLLYSVVIEVYIAFYLNCV